MGTQDKPRPRMRKLDELFLLDTPAEQNGPPDPSKRYQDIISIDRLVPFVGHPFHLYEGERLDDMVESIKKNGILVPIIAREKEGRIEILAGHNRVNASRIAGMFDIPTILLKDISDEEAWIYVVETNLMQRSFSDMSHSEKAAVISVQHSKMFSPGKRNDILMELKALENPHDDGENQTFPQVGERLHSDKKVGEMYSLSKNTVARYLRIHQLVPALKTMLDAGAVSFIPAVTLSFLKTREQKEVAHCIELNGFNCDMKKADVLRQYSQDGKLDEDSTFLILNGEIGQKPPPNRTPVVKVNKTVYARYFKPGQPAKEVQDIVEKALDMYFGAREQQKAPVAPKPSILGQLAEASKEAAAQQAPKANERGRNDAEL